MCVGVCVVELLCTHKLLNVGNVKLRHSSFLYNRCLLSFFALFVLIGSIYHVISHDYVASVLESLNHSSSEAKAQEVYEQVIGEHDQKGDSNNNMPEKCIGAGESDIRLPLDETPVYKEQFTNGNEAEVNARTNYKWKGITELIIEEDGTKIGKPASRKLGKYGKCKRRKHCQVR